MKGQSRTIIFEKLNLNSFNIVQIVEEQHIVNEPYTIKPLSADSGYLHRKSNIEGKKDGGKVNVEFQLNNLLQTRFFNKINEVPKKKLRKSKDKVSFTIFGY